MKKLFALAVAVVLLSGCTTDLSDQVHEISEYMADDTLSAATIEACRAKNVADLRVQQAKPACANVQEAERRKLETQMESADAKSNAKLEEIIEKRRQYRASKKQ